nr:hypothetical protein [Tanacetum cinerariifolium]
MDQTTKTIFAIHSFENDVTVHHVANIVNFDEILIPPLPTKSSSHWRICFFVLRNQHTIQEGEGGTTTPFWEYMMVVVVDGCIMVNGKDPVQKEAVVVRCCGLHEETRWERQIENNESTHDVILFSFEDDGDNAYVYRFGFKVLGLLVQYGVSKVWTRRIEGFKWIRRIHFMDMAYPYLQFQITDGLSSLKKAHLGVYGRKVADIGCFVLRFF